MVLKMKKNILVIPHIPSDKVKVREKEIAKTLAKVYNVHYLTWNAPHSEKLSTKIRASSADLFKRTSTRREGNLIIVGVPTLHKPLPLSRYFNRYFLYKYISRNNIDVVLNASYFFFSVPRRKDFGYFFDFVDFPFEENEKSGFNRFVIKHIREEVEKAEVIFACSASLVGFIEKNYGKKAILLPNGTDVKTFGNVKEEDVVDLRRRYNLTNKFVIGYISNFGPWSNLEFTLKVFKVLRSELKGVILFLVGPGGKAVGDEEEGIISTGSISPSEIQTYFKMIDVGILPSPPTQFRNMSFPLKVIEYTAARKFVISTPLTGVKQLNFPNILLVPEDEKKWRRAIKEVKERKWKKEWDRLIEPYDWEKICEPLKDVIDEK